MLSDTVKHLCENVFPAATDYEAAESNLSDAYQAGSQQSNWQAQARTAKRSAAELAIAIDGLADRAALGLGQKKEAVRNLVSSLCKLDNGTERPGCLARVQAVADAYKHKQLNNQSLPISYDDDVLVVGLGFGLDGYSIGKYSGVEVIAQEKLGQSWKFAGDAPIAIRGWICFLTLRGETVPNLPPTICGLSVSP